MNTKQVLYNALQVQLDTKKQAYENYHETVIKSAYNELSNEVKSFIESFISLGSAKFEFSNRKISINNSDNSWDNIVKYILYGCDKEETYVEVEWNRGSYNLIDKSDGKENINLIAAFVNNLKLVEDKWINEWNPKFNDISNDDYKIKGECDLLKSALNNLKSEIHNDNVETMKEIGFEIKSFKPLYSLDWNYDNDNNRIYKITTSVKTMKIQYGRSQYDTTWINGFKVLDKKGNKYNIEVYTENYSNKIYNVLEKKFNVFVNDVFNWENEQADKRKEETEKNFAERTK